MSSFLMLIEKGYFDLWRTQQMSLNLSSEPMIEQFMGLSTTVGLLFLDESDR